MRVCNPSNILSSPFLRIRRLLSIHFLPALVRILWIVVFFVVPSFSTYSTTAIVPVSCHPTIDSRLGEASSATVLHFSLIH
jgi:hypothetical protein